VPGNIRAVRVSLRKLALATTVMTVLLIAIGGLVRATGSGLGCGDDWPDCNGQLLPVLDARPVIIEWSHRAVAMVVGIMAALLVAHAFRTHRNEPVLRRLTATAFVLVVLQALLGRVVVKEELEVLLVVGHLATALLFLAVLIAIVAAAPGPRPRQQPNPAIARGVPLAAAAVFVLLLVGSYTSDFGYVPGWPLQDGRLLPNLESETQVVHFLHRVLAVAVAVIVAVIATRVTGARAEAPEAAKLAHWAVGLFAIELLIGAANVWTELNPIVVTLHLSTGALIWACVIGMWAVATAPAWGRSEDRERDAALAAAGAAD
jgi:cytochrome c oxidase assembly protein subunit 15